MHAQVVRAQVQPARVEAAVAVFSDDVVPAASEEHGYIRAYLFIDRATNRVMSLSLWETEADVVALAESGVYRRELAKVLPHLSGAPEREVYEVAFQD
jgi:heme-degrading monooxygenase HmoA